MTSNATDFLLPPGFALEPHDVERHGWTWIFDDADPPPERCFATRAAAIADAWREAELFVRDTLCPAISDESWHERWQLLPVQLQCQLLQLCVEKSVQDAA